MNTPVNMAVHTPIEIRASTSLLDRKEELASAITDAMYASDPTLMSRYGEAGRAKCLQDMRYSLEHLAPAVALSDPSLFTRYVIWLENMLAARGVPSDDVRRSLEATRRTLRGHLPAAETDQILPSLDAGLAALSTPAAA